MNMADYEVDNECVKRADKIVVDYWESIKHRMISTVALMWKDGLIKDEDIHAELGEILCGLKAPRENDEEIIYFNAVGAGILDIAVVTRCYYNAKKHFMQQPIISNGFANWIFLFEPFSVHSHFERNVFGSQV